MTLFVKVPISPESKTPAECLIDLAESILGIPGLIREVPTWAQDSVQLARADIAIRFTRLPPATRLRAIVEEWDYIRITREVF